MLKTIVYDALYVFINGFVNRIPFWSIRKLLYRMCGLKIGRKSRINMRCILFEPWRIRIGKNTIINEYSVLDGRGFLQIGDNCSISLRSIIYSSSHNPHSSSFEYFERKTVIGNGVWIGAGAIVLPGSILNNLCILGAGSVATGKEYKEKCIYAGVPAKEIKERKVAEVSVNYRAFFK